MTSTSWFWTSYGLALRKVFFGKSSVPVLLTDSGKVLDQFSAAVGSLGVQVLGTGTGKFSV